MPLKLSYDPNGLKRFNYDQLEDLELQRELQIWNIMKELDKAASVG
jgi:hypothetical protein